MNFVTVDNQSDRLTSLTELLKEAFPGCMVTAFTDPLLSAKYILNHEVDTVLAVEVMRPADGENLRHVIAVNKPYVKVILISEPRGQPSTETNWVRPITKEQIKSIKKQRERNL